MLLKTSSAVREVPVPPTASVGAGTVAAGSAPRFEVGGGDAAKLVSMGSSPEDEDEDEDEDGPTLTSSASSGPSFATSALS